MKDQKNRMVNERDFKQDPGYVAPDEEIIPWFPGRLHLPGAQ